jgi:hypothetical protein
MNLSSKSGSDHYRNCAAWESHHDFNEKTVSQRSGLFPELIIDLSIRSDFINLRNLSYNARYDGYFSKKIDKILI